MRFCSFLYARDEKAGKLTSIHALDWIQTYRADVG